MQTDRLIIAALTGGIASGKTTVARMFAEMGAHIIDTDLIARQVVEPGSPGLARVVQTFGPGCLTPQGALDRPVLRELIFSDPEARQTLNGILHPLIRREVKLRLERLARDFPGQVALVDVPLLFETGWYKKYDKIILVYVSASIQLARLMSRDNITKEQAQKALATQMPIDEKRHKATFLVDNTGPLDKTQLSARAVWRKLCETAVSSG